MRFTKTLIAAAIASSALVGCDGDTIVVPSPAPVVSEVKVAAFNLSFDRSTFEDLVNEMSLTAEEQAPLVAAYLDGTIAEDLETTAAKVIQIRNVAAIIQKNRPDVLMMGEYNNDGSGEDLTALKGFQDNYLSVAQSIDGAGGEANLEPIEYPFAESYATNTGLNTEFDLDNNGTAGAMPGDAWGFGFYHGQYAFALMSKYEIDTANTRTFQNFKWKDMPDAINPTIINCDDLSNVPGMSCGDSWYNDEEWAEVRMSSKNHVDAPIIIPTADGETVIHLLLSHPTPPVFEDLALKNKYLNQAEVQFWADYINNESYIYDDAGTTGGLMAGEHFVVMGDLNLDAAPGAGDGFTETMKALHDDALVNQNVTNGPLYPTSFGAAEYAANRSSAHPYPNRITAEFYNPYGGINADHTIPSASLNVIDSGVYWAASYEEGRKLFNDARIGQYGSGKDISSDHRMVWLKIDL